MTNAGLTSQPGRVRASTGHFNFTRDVFESWAQRWPDHAALWCVDAATGAEKRLTYAQLAKHARRATAMFHALGVERGDRVLIVLPRVWQWWASMLGLIRLGALPMPGTPLLTARDIAYRIEASGARAVLTDPDGAKKVGGFDGVRIVVGEAETGWHDFDEELAAADDSFDPPPTRAEDPGILYFTSGTTGHPKMVLHTQASYGRGHRLTGEWWLDLRPDDVHWNMSDTGWAKAAWSNFFGPWHMGACVFIVDSRTRFDAAAAVETLRQFPITTWCAPPTALRLITRQALPTRPLPKLRHCVSAGEPLNPEVYNAWQDATGLPIYEGYGQTETVVLVGNYRKRGDVIKPGSMGWPTPGFKVTIVDDELNELPDDQDGQIAVRVKPDRPEGLFKEYWRNPDENAERFRGDWYLTGDVARRDADGRFWFVGRADDVIGSAGYRIGPFEVESALIEHPAVLEAAVVGKPDETRGQIVKAFIVLRDEYEGSETLVKELQEHCKRVTAPYKYPREIEFLDELPKTISGKVRRAVLRQRA